MINPKLILRFDCHSINDIQVLRLPIVDHQEEVKKTQDTDQLTPMNDTRNTDKKILFLVAACNDNYIRFFNL